LHARVNTGYSASRHEFRRAIASLKQSCGLVLWAVSAPLTAGHRADEGKV
jgi:hypothetical protein